MAVAAPTLPGLSPSAGALTMSSLEIAERTGKRHDNVMRDARAMLIEMHGEGGVLSFEDTHRNPQNGQEYPILRLPKHECLTLITGYSVKLRAAIIARWIELEGKPQAGPAIPNFADPAAAARAWAEQYEARVAAERTKAEIGSRREATAMATAARANQLSARLLVQLDRSQEYATVKRMEALHHGRQFDWRLIKRISIERNMLPLDVFDANYGTVKSYHAEVWRAAYALELPEVRP